MIYAPEDSSNAGAGGDDSIPVCDYSGAVAANCESLVKNAGFAHDVSSWDPDGGVYGAWRASDANGSDSSGSIDVLNTLAGQDTGVAPGAARQCLPVVPGRTYDLAADVFVESGQGQGFGTDTALYVGKAVLGAFFFDDEACQGSSVGFFNAEEISATDRWVHVSASGMAPEHARAISIRLNALKPIREALFKATFDNVYVRERE